MPIVHNCEQNSEEWHRLRLGIPTASCFHRIITPKTLKPSKQADDYLAWLLAEWIYGAPLDSVQTDYMQRGHDMEPAAVKSYEFETGRKTETVGFITTDDGMIGASPDRLVVGCKRLLEIKAPALQTHVAYMLHRDVDDDYRVQLQGQLWVSGDEGVDIQSYYPGLPSVIIPVERDPKYQDALSEALPGFVARLLQARADLEGRYGNLRQPPPEPKADPLGVSDADVDAYLRSIA